MWTLLLEFLWRNKQLIAEVIGALCLAILCWWFFIHNPRQIAALEADKAELARMLEAKNRQISLYGDIEKGKVGINAFTHKQISSLRATARPRRTVIIRSGSVLPAMSPAGQTSH